MAYSRIRHALKRRTFVFVLNLSVMTILLSFAVSGTLNSADKFRLPEAVVREIDDLEEHGEPPHSTPECGSLTRHQIAALACQRATLAHVVTADARTRNIQLKRNCNDVASKIIGPFQNAVAVRLQQTAASNALKLHFAIAGSLHADRLIHDTEHLLRRQALAQVELVDRGVPIQDPYLIDRLHVATKDKRLENQSKLATFRIQLASLIGTECGCSHAPLDDELVTPSDSDVCDHIREALETRCDLITLKRLAVTINEDTLEVWDHIASFLSGVPAIPNKITFWKKFLRTRCSQQETANAVASRRAWLNALIQQRTQQISAEVEIAYEKKKSAALRWVNAKEQVQLWERRIAQLEEMARVRGNMAEQFEAQLNRMQAMAVQIERWVDWQTASVELKFAMGSP